jgi:4-hydroxy-tetrahydrodipicolinate synthase
MLESGVYPASVTPMDDEGRVDFAAIPRLLAHFRAEGCKGIVLAGTNGEGPSLSAVEKRDLIRLATPIFPDFKVIAGIATPSLDEAVWLANQASKAGAAAGLVMAPGYFRDAAEEGILGWFEKLFDSTELPILVYNFPQRTGFAHSADAIARLAGHERMIGLKDSSGNPANLADYSRAAPDKLKFVGNETLLLDALDKGWTGTISGAANCIPSWLAAIVHDWNQGKRDSARAKFKLVSPAIESLRGVPQPASNKALLHRAGILESPAVRLPLQSAPREVLQPLIEKLQTFL